MIVLSTFFLDRLDAPVIGTDLTGFIYMFMNLFFTESFNSDIYYVLADCLFCLYLIGAWFLLASKIRSALLVLRGFANTWSVSIIDTVQITRA